MTCMQNKDSNNIQELQNFVCKDIQALFKDKCPELLRQHKSFLSIVKKGTLEEKLVIQYMMCGIKTQIAYDGMTIQQMVNFFIVKPYNEYICPNNNASMHFWEDNFSILLENAYEYAKACLETDYTYKTTIAQNICDVIRNFQFYLLDNPYVMQSIHQ